MEVEGVDDNGANGPNPGPNGVGQTDGQVFGSKHKPAKANGHPDDGG